MFDTKLSKNSVFSKFEKLSERIEGLYGNGRRPFGMTFERILSPTRGMIGGAEFLLAGTNNYLGLTFSEECTTAAKDAIDRHGTATTGSRLANGTFAEHVELEAALKAFFGAASAAVFTTGYQANLATLSALGGKGDHLLIDADSHACIYDGCRLSDAETYRFRHNSPEDLAKRLSRLPETGARLVVIEGLYSMLGDVAPVAEFLEVAHAHNAMLYIDEAHSVGCYGPTGRGVAEAQGVLEKVDFISGTFSKSFASIGGFCISRHAEFDRMRLASRPYLFTASGTPSAVAAARAALDVIAGPARLERKLWARIEQLYAGLSEAGFQPVSAPGPIMAVERPDDGLAMREWNALMDAGIYVNLMIPPATPQGKSLLRISMSAAHTEADVDRIISAFRSLRALSAT